jgi:phage shock protein A
MEVEPMTVFKRISRLITANINHLLDQAEDPELMVKELIRDMEESIVELRRETVRAVTRQRQLEKQIEAAAELIGDLQSKAALALGERREDLARRALARKLQTERTRESLERELEGMSRLAGQLKNDLARLEDQAQAARRKKDELIRRRRAAESELRGAEAAKRSSMAVDAAAGSMARMVEAGSALETYEEEISHLEARAEAEREVLDDAIERELDLQKLAEDSAVEEELERLKQQTNRP